MKADRHLSFKCLFLLSKQRIVHLTKCGFQTRAPLPPKHFSYNLIAFRARKSIFLDVPQAPKKVFPYVEDRLEWEKAKNGLFSVKSLFDAFEGDSAIPFPVKMIWNACVPTNVGFFS